MGRAGRCGWVRCSRSVRRGRVCRGCWPGSWEEYPEVTVELRCGASALHAREGRLDLAFVSLPEAVAPGLGLVPIGGQTMRLACPAGHRLAGRGRVDLRELRGGERDVR
ncbi:LysR substrate-binding domain-containing protein [Nonomuraea terrae]|uniref:LysR substrate-binding domain-containing protein n=1 Tax=Nonomuraea terrae TaxID=2530383 RepID=UPI00379B933E